MGRNRKITEINKRSGAYTKNPARARARHGEPARSEPIGEPPVKWLAGAQSAPGCECAEKCALWHELAGQAPFPLKVNHRITLEMLCGLVYKMRHGSAKCAELSLIVTISGKLGLGDLVNQSRHASGKAPDRGGAEWGELVG